MGTSSPARMSTRPAARADSETSIFFKIRAGLPTTQTKSGTSLVTTLPAPTVTPLPMVTPGRTITLPPNQQSSPMTIGRPDSGPRVPFRTNGSRGCVPLKKEQLGPMSVRAPTVMEQVSSHTELKLTKTPLPSLRQLALGTKTKRRGCGLHVVSVVHLDRTVDPGVVAQLLPVLFRGRRLGRQRSLVVHDAFEGQWDLEKIVRLGGSLAQQLHDFPPGDISGRVEPGTGCLGSTSVRR